MSVSLVSTLPSLFPIGLLIGLNMNDDRTVFHRKPKPSTGDAKQYEMRVVLHSDEGRSKRYSFKSSFIVGRDKGCELSLDNPRVSRRHARISCDGKFWVVQDLGSTNGTFINSLQVDQFDLTEPCELRLGMDGALLYLEPPESTQLRQNEENSLSTRSVPRTTELDRLSDNDRPAVPEDSSSELSWPSHNYRNLLLTAVFMVIGFASFGVYEYLKFQNLQKTATQIFYQMKSLELQIEQQIPADQNQSQLAGKRRQLIDLQKQYELYVEQVGFKTNDLNDIDQIIFQMARIFGECEINMPDGFSDEVKRYILRWQSSEFLESAILRVQTHNVVPTIKTAMRENNLPLQFFYLGVQESGFQVEAVGPQTNYGIAKGPWQFIPSTATRYGLKTGPLLDQPKYDFMDERHDLQKSTLAAARYLRDIYNTEAQASGLLVMASYNWGEHRINSILRRLPENPAERNFWNLVKRYKIPNETYDYVLRIFSAAVIGENPKLFGFDFENPLKKG